MREGEAEHASMGVKSSTHFGEEPKKISRIAGAYVRGEVFQVPSLQRGLGKRCLRTMRVIG